VSEPLASVEFELASAPHLLSTMDYTYRERHGRFTGSRACPREGGGRHAPERLLPPQLVLSLPEGAIGIRPLDLIGVDPRSRKILASSPACRTTNRPSLPQTAIRGTPTATPPACTNFHVARLTGPA
jgi:hypothetical protein